MRRSACRPVARAPVVTRSVLTVAYDPTAFPTLDHDQIAVLEMMGARRRVANGEILYREGDAERVITHHGPGRFLGELNLLTGSRR